MHQVFSFVKRITLLNAFSFSSIFIEWDLILNSGYGDRTQK